VYNHFLRVRTDAWDNDKRRISHAETDRMLTILKRQSETAWLNEVSSVPLQQALRHLQSAFINFFEKRADYPTFKKRTGKQSATYTKSAFTWHAGNRTLKLAKIGRLKIKWSRPFAAEPTTVTLTKTAAGQYFISLRIDEPVQNMPPATKQIGIDVGVAYTLTTSEGEKVGNPKYTSWSEQRLALAHRRLSRKQKGSKNREKARLQVAKVHNKIARCRLDHLHKLSHQLIRENQAIYAEDLAVKNMLGNGKLAKHIADVGWGELFRQLHYKADWYGRHFRQIDRWYPSSKRCSTCGYVLDSLPLDIRQWTCPQCNAIHDRDHNAAINIHAAGQAVDGISVEACGASVRPIRTAVRTGTGRRSRNHSEHRVLHSA
jgi:putative transposase